jgi:phage shock protein PspC (stress-responsive transcriptional regulator)
METTTADGPHGTGAQPDPRRLVRTPDGKISGVAAGIGHYLGLDPTIVRIAFIVLAFAGGVGLLLYGVCWIVMPKGAVDDARPATPLDSWAILGIVGLVAGVGLLVGWHGIGGGGRAIVAVALIVGGVLLIGRKTGPWPPPDSGAVSVVPPAPSPTSPPGTVGVLPPPPTAGVPPPPPAADDPASTEPTAPEAATAASGRRAPLTGIVLSLLALGVALGVAAGLSDWIDVTAAGALAAALVVIGVGLAVAAFTGGAPLLFVVGGLVVAALLPAAALEPLVDDGVGDKDYRPLAAEELNREYRLGIGDLNVNLVDVDLQGRTAVVGVSVGIGSATVLVPLDADVVVRSHVDVGNLRTPDGEESGLDKNLGYVQDVENERGRLEIDLDVGAGEGVVNHVGVVRP